MNYTPVYVLYRTWVYKGRRRWFPLVENMCGIISSKHIPTLTLTLTLTINRCI